MSATKALMVRSYYALSRSTGTSNLLVMPFFVRFRATANQQWLGSSCNRSSISSSSSGKMEFGGGKSFVRTTSSSTTTRASPDSIDSPLMQSMENKIREHLNAESVIVKDAYGDGRHVSINVVSSAFEGQSAVNRQRMVYKAIWEELQNTVHAVDQMTTKTPNEAAADN